ncbi:hypothetical protein DENSPDRAFT_832419 [Dentipellis sp. KUC8613]|nr:hypothetical protein DENSPDRAFT_832419 [Dentipellis sp. KUC8613]
MAPSKRPKPIRKPARESVESYYPVGEPAPSPLSRGLYTGRIYASPQRSLRKPG